MTEINQLSDKELSEALNFHRRQRNLSRGVNESAHMRMTQMVRILEAEEARRLNEENPNHYVISKRQNGEYGVSQRSGNDYSWDHSLHHGTHKTVDAAKTWAAKHAGKYPHKIEVKEEAEQIDELSKNTLKKYRSAAWKSAGDHYDATADAETDGEHNYHMGKGDKRMKGYELATAKTGLKPHQTYTDSGINTIPNAKVKATTSKVKKEEVELDEGIKEKISGVIRREKQKEYPLLQNRRDVAATKAGAAYAAGDHKKGDRYMKWRGDNMKKEEVEELDELSKDTLNSYWKKAATARYPLDVKARKAQDQKTNRIRSGKPLAGYKPKDELSADEKRTHMNRIHGMNRAGKTLFRSEEVELDEDTMPSNVASSLSDRHFTAAFSHKKNGNMKGYAAHLKVANRIEDAVIRAGSHMPIKSKQIETASDKAFKEHPHRAVKTEEVELDEASYRDIGARNMLKADRKAEKELAKMRAQQAKANAKAAAKASKPEEFKEETNLRITKVYNKWPKKATYAVHSPDRKYYKEFDSMEAANKHHSEKTGK